MYSSMDDASFESWARKALAVAVHVEGDLAVLMREKLVSLSA